MNLPFRISDVFGFDGTFQRDFGGRKENGDLVQNLGSILAEWFKYVWHEIKLLAGIFQKGLYYTYYMYTIISLNHTVYIYICHISIIYIYINTLILWQTANWNFTLDSTRKPAVCRWGVPRETPKDGSRFETPKSIHPCGERLDEKCVLKYPKPWVNSDGCCVETQKWHKGSFELHFRLSFFLGGGSKNASAWQIHITVFT